MIPVTPPPTIDPLVEMLFQEVLHAPEGYAFHYHDNQLLYPTFGQDKWRLLLRKDGTQELVPMFLDGDFVRKLARALNAMQRELNKAVSEDLDDASISGESPQMTQ